MKDLPLHSPQPLFACRFQVCMAHSLTSTWHLAHRSTQKTDKAGDCMQLFSALCPQKHPLPLSEPWFPPVFTKELALSSCCPPCMSGEHAWRPAGVAETRPGLPGAVSGCALPHMCCSRGEDGTSTQAVCFSRHYFSLKSCICIRKFPYVSLFFFGLVHRLVVKKKLPSFAPKEI